MNLKVFDISVAKKQKPGRSTVQINFKVGTFTFGNSAMDLMDIKLGDQVKVGLDEKKNDWYVWKVKKDGFTLRGKKSKIVPAGYAIMFNSVVTAEAIAKSLRFTGESAVIKIGSEAIISDDDQYIVYWPLITAALQN